MLKILDSDLFLPLFVNYYVNTMVGIIYIKSFVHAVYPRDNSFVKKCNLINIFTYIVDYV